MMKVKVRKLGAAVITASNVVLAAQGAVGCGSSAADAVAPDQHEVELGSASSAYSVTDPGSGVLTLNGTWGDYQMECSLAESTTDEFVRSGETLALQIPAYQIWQALHPDHWEPPEVDRVKQTSVAVTALFYRDGEQVGSTTVKTSTWTGDDYWMLQAKTDTFVVPQGVDEVRFALAYTDAGDGTAAASVDASVVRPLTVFGGDLPDKAVLFDSDGTNLRNRVIEGGGPVAGANVLFGYTEYRADTVVDASKIDRRIGKAQGFTRFGTAIQDIYGELVHEVTMGVYFDDQQGWRAETPMTATTGSVFAPQPWRKVYQANVAVPANARKMQVYYHVKTWLVVDYSRYGSVTEQWYQQGQRILVAERWDNPQGPGTNFDLGVEGAEVNPNMERTVVFLRAETSPGQDMFVRGGIDHGAAAQRGVQCVNADNTPNFKCAIPIVHRNLKNPTTVPWKPGDRFLDWYGHESTQVGVNAGLLAQGSPADWTTNVWPENFGPQKTVAADGYGLDPLNTYGMHYWMLDVDMDCSRAYADSNGNRWFEVKAYISNGPGWEPDIKQVEAPYPSNNHFGRCGMVNVFEWGKPVVTFVDLP